ncbi:MAG: hypothetical protein Ct9H300mP13_3090 [Gammaproteobacteria bacterium]|nr:MAG: hypothetical protein Ct9H300mP13_3090 [Gammaproteobacteria bacterium]
MKVGQCFYAPLVDEAAGLLNDPVILMRAPNWFWFSIADADILLWAKGLALGMDLDVEVTEPDVSPLAVKGASGRRSCRPCVWGGIRSLRYFQFRELPFADRFSWWRVLDTANREDLRYISMTVHWGGCCGIRCGNQVACSMWPRAVPI